MATILPRTNREGQVIGYQAKVRRVGHKPVSKTFEKRRDAERWAKSIETDMDRRVFQDYSQADETTLGALLRRYREAITPKKRGAEQEAGHFQVIEDDEICLRRLSGLSPQDIASFRDRMLAADYAPATVVRRMNLIATAIAHGRREWSIHMPSNPAEAKLTARPKGADRKRERRLVPERAEIIPAFDPDQQIAIEMHVRVPGEEERLIAGLAAHKHGCWLVPMAQVALETAARQGEICALTWEDIDLKKRVMTVRGLSGDGSKNGEVRRVPLSTAAIAAHSASLHSCEVIAPSIPGTEHLGIKDLTFHDLRHEATSRLAKIYPNPLELMRITGHKSLATLARYYHADAEELAQRLA
ncbi:phage integrase family protein [Nitrospirillum amazonense]|uniref:Phage integrase family protein n=1 Tax=Nitrospirillum amazonense TaxID=28077 RepID=A0A560EI81_9PROT|nr:site-specific integrase [Nitrospirillum amazonense]TWB09080.1 phage integrase family protein [Nitrospirillum amazonense]